MNIPALIERLRETSKKATQSEWADSRSDAVYVVEQGKSGGGFLVCDLMKCDNSENNSAYIATACPANIKRLLQHIGEQEKMIYKLKVAIEEMCLTSSYDAIDHIAEEVLKNQCPTQK